MLHPGAAGRLSRTGTAGPFTVTGTDRSAHGAETTADGAGFYVVKVSGTSGAPGRVIATANSSWNSASKARISATHCS